MKLIHPNYFFEPHGEGFIYRPTAFSAGYAVTAAEKARLLDGLRRLDKRLFFEGLSAIAFVAFLLLSGIVRSATPVPWFAVLSVAAVALIALTALIRKRRLIMGVLGTRPADVPRLPLRQAISQPRRPVLAKRHALPILRSVIALFAVGIVVVNGLALVPIIFALQAHRDAISPADHDAIAETLSRTLYNPTYWLVFVGVSVVLLGCIALVVVELRRLRKLPD